MNDSPVVTPPAVTSKTLISGDYECTAYSNGVATITKYTGSAAELTIPSEIEGYKVTAIGYQAFYECDNLIGVTIPNSVTSIGDRAFEFCGELASVIIPNSVTSIGALAFWGCVSLESVTIPNSVTSIGHQALAQCIKLTGIWVDANNPNYSSDVNGVLFNKDKTELIQAPGRLSGSYQIPSSVTSVGNYAVAFCYDLADVIIPSSVTRIGNYAFAHCDDLIRVTIPSSVTYIGLNTFFACGGLTSVTIPDSVTNIRDGAFEGCDSLTTVYFSSEAQKEQFKDCFPSNAELIVQ